MIKSVFSHSGIGALLLSFCIVAAYHAEYDHVGGNWLSSSFALNGYHKDTMSIRDTPRLEFSRLLSSWLYQRELAIGDFQDLNALYQNAAIQLPNTTLSGKILGFGWSVDVTDLRCRNLSIGDLEVSYARDSNQLASIIVDAIQLDFTCLLDYQYSYLFFNGGGQATAITNNNNANVTVAFTSNNFDQEGPTGLQVPSCQASFNFADLNFNGNGIGLVSDLLNVVGPLLKGFIQQKTEDFACQALSKLNTTATQLLQSVSGILEPYLNKTALSTSTLTEAELLQNATNVTLLSYQDPNGTLASAVDLLIKEAGSFLGGESSTNANNASGQDLNVNDLMRSYVLDQNGSLTFNASYLSDAINNGTLLNGGGAFTQTLLRLDYVRIVGLDSFTRFNFAPISNYTLEASFTLASLSLEASFFWEIQPPDATSSSPNVTENLLVQLALGQVNVTASLLAAIDQGLLGSLPLGALLNTSGILDCLISVFYNAEITTLEVMVENIGQPVISGFQSSPGLERVVNTTLYAVYDMYHAVLQRAIPGFFQETVRNLVSKLIRDRLQQSHCQPPKLSNSTNTLVDLRDLLLPPTKARALNGSGTSPYGGLASFVKGFIDTQLLSVNNASGLPNINDVLIARLSKRQSGTAGTFQYKGDLLTLDRTVNAEGLYAQINVQVNEARVENFVVGEPLAFLDPVLDEPYLVNNTASFGANDSRPLQLRAHVLFNLQGRDGFEINDDVALGIDIHGANLVATTRLELSEDKFLSFPLGDFFNLHCWLATIPAPALDARGVRIAGMQPTAGFQTLDVFTDKVNFNVTCLKCTGDSTFRALSDNLQTEQGSNDASQSAQHLISYATKFLGGEFLQVRLDRMIAQAPNKCPHSPSYNPQASSLQYKPFETKSKKDSVGFLVGLLVATACLIVATLVVRQMVGVIVRRRHRKWLQTLPPDQVLLIYRQQSLEQRNEKKLNEFAHSMFQSPAVPVFVRWAVPVVVLANVGLFLSGHLSIAGTVSIRAEFAGQVLVVDDFYQFSIVQTAIELWKAGGKVLAILIFLFSGVWPYTKQLATLTMWFLPPRWLPLPRRGSLFGWLDLLAKWSVIDIFFMILSLVAFRVTIASPKLSYLPTNFYKVDLLVIPLWGLYANLIAQLISQVSAHFIVHFHRRTVVAAKRDQDLHEQTPGNVREDCFEQPSQQDQPEVPITDRAETIAERLKDHAFARPHRGETDKLKVESWVPSLFCLTAVMAAVLVVLGCALPSLSFNAQGIVGVLIKAGQGFRNNDNENSVFSIARLLVGEAQLLDTGKDYIGMISIAVLFIATTFVVPLIQAFLLVVQFLLPLTRQTRNRLAVAIEILEDWQYVDVYVISILITTSQLGNVSAYLVNPYCSSLQNALSSLVFYGLLKPDDAQCFHVRAGIDSGTYVLLAAALFLTFLHTFVTKALAQYRRDISTTTEVTDEDCIHSSTDNEEVAKAIERVHPASVMFTDNFRWLLEREIPRPPKTRHEETFDEADYDAGASPFSEDCASR